MKMAFRTLFAFVSLMFSATTSCEAAEGGEVLWWLIDEDYANITGKTDDGREFTAEYLSVNGARIRYQSETGEVGGYLTLFGLDGNDDFVQYDGVNGVKLPAEYFGSLGGLSGASYSFVLELGNWADGQWAGTSMESHAESYTSLVANKHITKWQNQDTPGASPWTPTEFRVVPEPNSGLMLLIGGALLALRRRRSRKDC